MGFLFMAQVRTYAVFGAMQSCSMSHDVYLQAHDSCKKLTTVCIVASLAAPWETSIQDGEL